MKNTVVLFCLFFLGISLFGEVKIRDLKGNLSAGNDKISMYLLNKRNYAFNLTGKDDAGKNFGLVIESIIWYHGRSGNTDHIYQDQSETKWKPLEYKVNGSKIITRTANADFDTVREITFFDDLDAVTFEYILTVKESRDHGVIRFPLTRLTKEITEVSFDDGALEKFATSAKPSAAETVRSRAFILHIPARNKSLLMLIDVNLPLKYGHKLGIAPVYSPGSWCRSVNFNHLYQPEFPFYKAGDKLGMRLAFALLDGGKLSDLHKKAAKELAVKLNFAKPEYTPADLADVYEKPSPLAASFAGIPGVAVWQESPMKRVYPAMNTPRRKAEKIALSSAANERESIQIILKPQSKAVLEKVEFSDLTAAGDRKIAAKNFYANLLGVQKVATPRALFYGETRFPDKLRPVPEALPAKLKAGQNTVCHLTFFAPPGTPGGVYKGSVALTISGKKCVIPVELKVWGFELPQVSRYTAHGLLWSSLPEHREEVLQKLAQYGMNGSIYYGGQKQLREIFDGKELRFKDDLALAEKALKVYHQPMFQAPYLFLGAWDWKPGKKVQFLNLDLETEEFNQKFTNYLASFHRQVKAKGILDRSFIYMWDEMTGGHYAAMEKTVNMVHKHAPGIRLMTVSAPDPMVLKYNDIITTGPFGQWWAKNTKAVVDKALADGKEFWIYLNGTTFALTGEPTIPRVTPWLCYANGFTGYLQWSMDYNWKYGTFEKNGDVWILYPGYDKPVYSARLEYFRDGVEDFNMMYLTRKLPPQIREQLDKEIARVVPVMGKTNPDITVMNEVRNRIGETLDKYLEK